MYSWHGGVFFKRKKPDAIYHRAFNLKTNPYTVIREVELAMLIFTLAACKAETVPRVHFVCLTQGAFL